MKKFIGEMLLAFVISCPAFAVPVAKFEDTDTYIRRAGEIVIAECVPTPPPEIVYDGFQTVDVNILKILAGHGITGHHRITTIYLMKPNNLYLLCNDGGNVNGTDFCSISQLSVVEIPINFNLDELNGKDLKEQVQYIFSRRLIQLEKESKPSSSEKELLEKAVSPGEQMDANVQDSQDEDYKVYSDLLMQLYPDVTQKDIFVIRQTTRDERKGLDQESAAKKYLKEKFGDELSDELIENYFKVNSKAAELQDRFGKRLNIIFVSNAQVKEIFEPRDTGWQRFYAEFPHAKGITDVSRIAYNAEKTKAFLYYRNIVSPVGGEGYYVLMVRQGDKWVIQKKDLCWIS